MDAKDLTKEAICAQQPATAYKLSKVLGVKPDTVYAWRDGRKMPNGRNLMRLMELAGKIAAGVAAITIATLLSGYGDLHAAQEKSVLDKTEIHIMRMWRRLSRWLREWPSSIACRPVSA